MVSLLACGPDIDGAHEANWLQAEASWQNPEDLGTAGTGSAPKERLEGQRHELPSEFDPDSLTLHDDSVLEIGFAERYAATAPQRRAQKVYLALQGLTVRKGSRGLENARTDRSDLLEVETAILPPFDASAWNKTAAQARDELLADLRAHYSEWQVDFVTERPATGDYTTLVVGGTSAALGLTRVLAGYAPLDIGNVNPNDIAFVFSEQIGAFGYSLRTVAAAAAHELGHALGLRHIQREADVMAANACACQVSWGAGYIAGTHDQWQDDRVSLNAVLFRRGEDTSGSAPVNSCFADVFEIDGEPEICWLAEEGITSGCGGQRFCPGETVTRAQMAIFLTRFFAMQQTLPVAPATLPFADIETDHWAYAAIGQLYRLGITAGTSPTTFSPEQTVTRGQMSIFLERIYEKLGGSEQTSQGQGFDDVEGHYAESAIERMAGLGVFDAQHNNAFGPDDGMTRVAMAVSLYRLWERLGGGLN